METNHTITEFVIIGMSNVGQFRLSIFLLLLVFYFFIIIGNSLISLVILINRHLHTPMYIFISMLSFLEIWCTTITLPGILVIVLMGRTRISINGCFAQMYLFHSLGITENFMLNAMAYDRYVAICNPFQYHAIMTPKICKILIGSCWFIGFMSPIALLILLSQLTFCGSNEIFHVFCDSSPVLNLACAETHSSHIVDFAIGLGMIIFTSIFILLLYIKIMVTIAKMRLSEERKKAFANCISHFVIVLVFYASVAFMYIVLHGDYGAEYEQAVAINYSVVTPLFNPIIYSFRNKEIKNSLKKFFYSVTLVSIFNETTIK